MTKIRVLIVDDSQMVREMLADILSSDPGISVAGMATNGIEAIALIKETKPDIVAMDIEMPKMGGLDAIESIMATTPVPIIVITSLSRPEVAFQALAKGALEVFSKSFTSPQMADELIAKVKQLAKVKVIRHILKKAGNARVSAVPILKKTGDARVSAVPFSRRKVWVKSPEAENRRKQPRNKLQLVVIASSTGGPRALSQLFADLRDGFPVPIIVAQHMSDGFMNGLVEWLNRVTSIKVKIARSGEFIRENHAYFPPSGMHIIVSAEGRITLEACAPGDLLRPSCDRLLTSAGNSFGANCVGVVLTGMGRDGTFGLDCIQKHGGLTVAQDESTSVVYGMPKVAIESGLISKVSPLGKIGDILRQHYLSCEKPHE